MKMRQAVCLAIVLWANVTYVQAQTCNGESWAPDSRYTINNDIVVDNKTGLEWKRCPEGMDWNSNSNRCYGNVLEMTASNAMRYIDNVTSQSWRLPTVDELASLRSGASRESGCYQPAINQSIFPGMSAIEPYWGKLDENKKLGTISFRFGEVGLSHYRDETYAVRLVRAYSNAAADKATKRKEFPQYILNSDGTVYDKNTNLIWMRCNVGQTWSRGGCIGDAKIFTWDDARNLKYEFANKTDWRLPTIDELDSLVFCPQMDRKPSFRPNGEYVKETNGACHNAELGSEQINTSAFVLGNYYDYWSSSQYIHTDNSTKEKSAWAVHFRTGIVSKDDVEHSERLVRLVRVKSSQPISKTDRYIVNQDGTVYDKETNLVWMRCSIGQTWDGKTCNGKAQFFTWNEAIKLKNNFAGNSKWRLPTVGELDSLVFCSEGRTPSVLPINGKYDVSTNGTCKTDYHQQPTIDLLAFPNTPIAWWYWSSTPDAHNSENSWGFDFSNGYFYSRSNDETFHVRLVQTKPGEELEKYILYQNGTAYDKETNLTWMRCSLGQSWDGKTCNGEAKEYTWRDAIKLKHNFAGSTAWRLPTIDELESLVLCSEGRHFSSTFFY